MPLCIYLDCVHTLARNQSVTGRSDKLNATGFRICESRYRLETGMAGGSKWVLRKPVVGLSGSEILIKTGSGITIIESRLSNKPVRV